MTGLRCARRRTARWECGSRGLLRDDDVLGDDWILSLRTAAERLLSAVRQPGVLDGTAAGGFPGASIAANFPAALAWYAHHAPASRPTTMSPAES